VCGEETDKLADIERTIRLRIPRETVRGFAPHGSEAPLMEPPRRERRRSAEEDRLTGGRRREQARPSAAAPKTDPIFSRPYEPGVAPPATAADTPEPKKPQRPVAALLGGFVRKTT
jgi:hypothetical protein